MACPVVVWGLGAHVLEWCAAMAKVAGWKLVTPMPLPHIGM